MISIVSTYKNRRPHIEQTLPTWLNQTSNQYEIIIVDYDSDDDISPLLESVHKQVIIKHVRCTRLPKFALSHARNIGSRYAGSGWMLFLDIDTELKPHAIKEMNRNTKYDALYFAAEDSKLRKEIINGGMILVKKEHHDDICGFNEEMQGWGFEDIDYKRRLESNNISMSFINNELYLCLDHEDSERTQCYAEEKEISWTKNRQIALQTWKNKNFGSWNGIEIIEYNEL